MNNTVAVVIINWNGQKLLKRFLPSVINFSEEAKIYIIDNFSTDNSIQFVNKNYPKIKIINLNKNYGYAEGYNLGLKHVKEDIYILLNKGGSTDSGAMISARCPQGLRVGTSRRGERPPAPYPSLRLVFPSPAGLLEGYT